MARNDCTKVWELSAGQIVELDDARGTQLRPTRGMLWVTMERDPRDIVLEAGDAFTVDRNGVTLVEAQGRTTVCVQAPHVGGPHLAHVAEGWSARFWASLHRWYRSASSRRRFVPYV